jgi:hypothetical protein
MNLATVPVPVEHGVPCRAKVTSLPDGSWSLAWCLDSGLRVEPFGPAYPDVRRACRAAIELNARAEV